MTSHVLVSKDDVTLIEKRVWDVLPRGDKRVWKDGTRLIRVNVARGRGGRQQTDQWVKVRWER